MTSDMRPIVHLRGRVAVLERRAQLAVLAERSGQPGAVTYLELFLSVPYFGSKIPHAILLIDDACEPYAAVLLFEYCVVGFPTGVFIPADSSGELTIIAPAGERVLVGIRAAQFLLSHRGSLILLSVYEPGVPLHAYLGEGTFGYVAQRRVLSRTLPLAQTIEATLAQMGPRSRRNLRYFSRRVQTNLYAKYFSHAEISEGDFVELNRRCSFPVPDWVAVWRYRTAHSVDGCFFAGLRAGDGRWLSMMGGRRQNLTSIVDWQMNLADLPSLSLGTAMRFFQLDYEISLGSRFLRFEGGTPHSMQSAFLREHVVDLLLARKPLSSKILRQIVMRVLPKGNVLTDTLVAGDLIK